LEEPLIGVRESGRERRGVTLPSLLEMLAAGVELEFTALRPHQRPAWHAFLAQVAALALVAEGREPSEYSAEAWSAMLHGLAGDDDAWRLVVPDVARPALMQPPVPAGVLDTNWATVRYPDELDILVTGRNHDVKSRTVGRPAPEHWLYALVTLQTAEGFSGRGNYGIARMNSGFGSRPQVSTTSRLDWAHRFRRDVPVLLRERRRLLEDAPPAVRRRMHPLLWLEPWDGETSAGWFECDPLVIEVCRRVRLLLEGDSIVARKRATQGGRLAAAELKGATGDIWTPVNMENAALTLGGRGFDYDLTRKLIFGTDYRPSPAQALDASAQGRQFFVAEALARGQGKTEGWHERVVPLPQRVVPMLLAPDRVQFLGEMARQRVDDVHDVQRRALHPALCVLVQGAAERPNLKDDRTRPWTARLTAAVDREFFDRLWADAEREPEEARADWIRWLVGVGEEILEGAMRSTPLASARRFRVLTTAESYYRGSTRKLLEAAGVAFPGRGPETDPQEE